METLDPDLLDDTRQLIPISFDRPERRIRRTLRSAASELVIEDHRPIITIRELGHGWKQVVVRDARSAVDGDQRGLATLAADAVPDPAAGNTDDSLSSEGPAGGGDASSS